MQLIVWGEWMPAAFYEPNAPCRVGHLCGVFEDAAGGRIVSVKDVLLRRLVFLIKIEFEMRKDY